MDKRRRILVMAFDDEEIDKATIVNKKDIEELQKSLENNQEAVEDLTRTLRGNGGNDGIIARVSSLETQLKGLWFASGIFLSALITGFFI